MNKNVGANMFEIRRLSLGNLEEIKKLYRDIFTREPWNDDWNDDTQLTIYITELIGNNNSLTFGLYDSKELIGLSMGSVKHWHSCTEYNIAEFCIKTEKQGQGLGTMFLKRIESTIKELGINAVFLQTERTVPAYDFYKKNDFRELKNHVSMKKRI